MSFINELVAAHNLINLDGGYRTLSGPAMRAIQFGSLKVFKTFCEVTKTSLFVGYDTLEELKKVPFVKVKEGKLFNEYWVEVDNTWTVESFVAYSANFSRSFKIGQPPQTKFFAKAA